MVPTDAVHIVDDGDRADVSGRVVGHRFDRGRYVVTVEIVKAAGTGIDRLVVRHGKPPVVGSLVDLTIEVGQAVALAET